MALRWLQAHVPQQVWPHRYLHVFIQAGELAGGQLAAGRVVALQVVQLVNVQPGFDVSVAEPQS